jgi:surface protein
MTRIILALATAFSLTFIPLVAQAQSVTPLTDANFNTAIAACLAEDPVGGVCTNYGQSSGFGTMPNWDTSQVTDMSQAFSAEIHGLAGVANFNANIGSWNTSNVTDMTKMFRQCEKFNSDISSWDVGSVTHFKAMFFHVDDFNIDIGQWDVSSGQDFFWMFWQARTFNQDISGWDVTSAQNLGQMFRDTQSFAQDIRGWDVSSIPDNADWQLFGNAVAMNASAYTFNINTKNWFIPNHPTRDTIAPTITFSPTDSATGVAADANITMTFSEAVRLINDGALSDTNIDGLITLKDTDLNGSDIAFDATTSGNIITINPSSDFSSGQAVYVAIGAAVEDTSDNALVASSATFTVAQYSSAPNSPTALVASAGDAQVSIAFTAPSNNGGAAISDYQYELDNSGTWISAGTTSSPVVITGLTNGTAYSITLRAVNSVGNGNESAAVNVLLGSPASEFAAKEDVIRSVITDDAQRSLNSALASNTRLTRDARGRFLTSRTQMQSDGSGLASRNNIALDVDGIAVATPEQLSTQGMFFAQTGNFEGTQRRLVLGDFDIQRDWDTGSTTATINGKVAWEQMLSEQTMLGYYLGGEVARSNIQGSFTGTQDKYGVSVGGYFVHALQEHVFLDGFASLGAGRNNLEIADATLDLTSDYTTHAATMGAAVSGVYEYGQYDFHPELAFSYGKTWIGDVGFTGVAYGLTDDALSLDAGDVSIANLTLRPEIVWALDAETVADSNTQLSFAPRFICQRTSAAATTQDCGAGAEIGLSSTSEDGLSSAHIRLVMDRVGNSNRSSFALNFERSF